MTKQEEIREGKQERLKQIVHEVLSQYVKGAVSGGVEIALLQAFSNEGVVIRVERELPKMPLDNLYQVEAVISQVLKDADYVATIPLIIKGNCYFCSKELTEEYWCYGCLNFVCDDCDNDLPVGKHKVEMHKEEEK